MEEKWLDCPMLQIHWSDTPNIDVVAIVSNHVIKKTGLGY